MGLVSNIKARLVPLPPALDGEDDPFFDVQTDNYVPGADRKDSDNVDLAKAPAE